MSQVVPTPTSTESLARFFRVFSMGATIVYVFLGIATAGAPATPSVVIGGLLLGVVFHVFAFVGNDVIDLPIDRGDPRRARGPLVRGVVSPPTAMTVALAALPVMFGLLHLLGAPRVAVSTLTGAAVSIAAYNLLGKVLPVPFVADYVQGVGWALLLVTGAALAGGATIGTALAALFVVVYVAMVNGVHGAIRDVGNDTASGAHTTALHLGVRLLAHGGIRLPARVIVYTVAVVFVQAGLLAGVLWWGIGEGTGWPRLAAAVTAVGLYAASVAALVRAWAARSRPREALAHGTWHLFLAPAALVAACLWPLPGWAGTVTVAAFLVPPLAYGRATRRLEFDLPGTSEHDTANGPRLAVRVAAIWEMLRPGVPASAAALTTTGAILAGPRWPDAVLGGLAAAAIVASANIFNDRCDQAADEINRPDRPLPSGRIAGGDVDRVVLGFAVAGVIVAVPISAAAAAAAGTLLAIATGYSLVARPLPVGGELTAALLFGLTILFGGAFAGERLAGIHFAAAGMITLFVLAREILMGVRDRAGDLVAGYRTVAAVFGPDAAITSFRVGAAVFALAVTSPLLASRDLRYLSSVLPLVITPVAAALWSLRRPSTPGSIERALSLTGTVFGTGLVPLLLLA